MSHNIYIDKNNNACIASFRESPWHQLGVVFKDEHINGEQLLKLAHLDWRVVKASLTAQFCDQKISIPDSCAIVREDTGEVFGVVGTTYEIFQNHEMMQVFEEIRLRHQLNFNYEVAGAIRNNHTMRVWVLARVKDLDYNVKDDKIHQYLLITSTHDGTGALTIFPTAIRVVCQNTMNLAFSHHATTTKRGSIAYSIKHTKHMRTMVQQAVRAINDTIELNRFNREIHLALAEVPASKELKHDFFDFIVDYNKDETKHLQQNKKRAETLRNRKLEMLEYIWNSPTNRTNASSGTAWGLLQTGIEYVDFYARTRITGHLSEFSQRFDSAQFGNGSELKTAMQRKIVELAGINV